MRARAWMMDVGAGQRVAAGTHHVVEYLLSPKTIGLPLAPAHCPAVLIWREQIIPSVDLTGLSPNRGPVRHAWQGAVVLAYQDAPGKPLRYGALLVYAAPEETWVSNDMACPLPEASARFQYFTCACFSHQEQAIPVMDTARLFSESPPWTPQKNPSRIETASSPDAVAPASNPRPDASVQIPPATGPAANENHTAAIAEIPPEERRAWRRAQARLIIEETLAVIHNEVGLKRVLFAVLARNAKSIRAHSYRGLETDSPLRGFRFERGDSSLFARLVARPQHIWLRAGNQHRLAPLNTTEMRESLGESEFFASSIFVRSKLLGVCYGDEFPSTQALDEVRYQRFKDICISMTRRLGEIAG